jgi:hypothetical protein
MDDYVIVRVNTLNLLVLEVNSAIKDGYVPQGGIAVCPLKGYLQACVKVEK